MSTDQQARTSVDHPLAIRCRPRRLLLAAAMVLALGISGAAGAAGVLDQSQEAQTDLNGIALVGAQVAAQSFTAGRTGALDHVDLRLTRYGTPGNLIVEIHGVQAGVPSSGVLASGVVAEASLDSDPYTFEWESVALSPLSLVHDGTEYAIVLRDAGGANFPIDYYVWADDGENPYTRGTALTSVDGGVTWFVAPHTDTAFRTYVINAPTTADQCKNDGWQTFGIFKNQGECVSYVATGRSNPSK